MAWRAATGEDLPTLMPVLRARVQSSMFLLENLGRHGLGSDHANGLTLWRQTAGPGVFGITNGGSVLMQAPEADAEDWRAAGALIADREIHGVLGDAPQVRRFIAANGMQHAPATLNRDDPAFHLDLGALRLELRPDEEMIPLADAPRDLVENWRAAYEMEAIHAAPEKARNKARADIAEFIAKDSHRVLIKAGTPVAMTGLNASVGDVVQVGGVYTPPALRGSGYARRVVGRHLLQARDRGASQAVLFAASAQAARAYQAIGFQPAGAFALVLYATPVRIMASRGEGGR
ncbi:GNAT family N-acetyltransferase [Phaeobacter sp. HF9A]|uniref:GNAT family N-acetyltransferase n=1 Tax=Phaeobacter sp. HF9A TaxID=2721561 RepID=UPI00142FAF8F|nr:GNAT family N-acetyltransferase [Phaeobacter sp. HF9A]NIZ14985.1 GNAT family N-acetyltransferase [Phaeobacter sp. HF9A]